jgi:DNA-directed RNA polymerase beta' subunit
MVSTQSGAKGSMDNVIQITCCVGDQYVDDNESISSAHKGPYFDLSDYQKDTFCKNSFMSGLNPTEYFFHARAGREGVINTSMRTPKSGYIHRRLAKALEDCILHYDGTVRTVDSQGKNKIIRFQY